MEQSPEKRIAALSWPQKAKFIETLAIPLAEFAEGDTPAMFNFRLKNQMTVYGLDDFDLQSALGVIVGRPVGDGTLATMLQRLRPEATQKGFLPSGFVTFVFTDIVGSTDIGEKMSGNTTVERQRKYARTIKYPLAKIVANWAERQNGIPVTDTGDGALIAFADAENAVVFGLGVQRDVQSARIETPIGIAQLRIGMNSGQAEPVDGNYTATAINKAQRVQGHAKPGSVFLSKESSAVVESKLKGVTFRSEGIHSLKGIGDEELFSAEAE